MSDTLTDASTTLTAQYDQAVEAIRDDRMLSEEAKQIGIAKQWVKLTDSLAAAAEKQQGAVDTERQRLEQKLIAPDTRSVMPGPDRVALSTSFRDATARAAATEGTEELTTLLKRASRSGDQLQAKAALAIAFERDDLKVINDYADLYPGTERDLQRLVDLTGSSSSERLKRRFSSSMAMSPRSKPKELGFLRSDQIRELADS